MNTAETKLGASFGWLNATQFLGALNDNIFRLLVVLFLIDPQDPSQSSSVMALALAVFVVPFLLFSALAGKLADSFSKRDIIVSVKVAEAVVMSAGFVAFMLENAVGLYVVLFMMAAQSAFFAPCKYGIVPELVKEQQLSRANGLLVALTYLAIIMGIASPFVLNNILSGSFTMAASICIAIAVVGLIVSLPIRRTPSAGAKRKASVFFKGSRSAFGCFCLGLLFAGWRNYFN